VDVTASADQMSLPTARGPRSAAILAVLAGEPSSQRLTDLMGEIETAGPSTDPLRDDDLQLSLLVLYELHYRGIEGVDDAWEWNTALLAVRSRLEVGFEAALRTATRPRWDATVREPGRRGGSLDVSSVIDALLEMTAPSGKPGLSSYLAKRATLEQYRELLIHRSVYHLKEADPHTFGIPRLSGSVKAALVEIQADEYGGGRPEWVHAAMFARSMAALGLENRYGYYVDEVPATTLATANAMSLFGLHRRLRGALVGHLTAFEMTSTQPNRLYGNGLRRLGLGTEASAYFDEHVEADAVHEQIALRDLAGGLVRQEPDLAPDVLFGAAAALALDEAAGEHMLSRWQARQSSLRWSDRAELALDVISA
jgi:hypothetical protein